MAASTEALIVEYVAAPTPLSPPTSSLSSWSSPLPHIPSPPLPVPSPPLPLPSPPTRPFHTDPTYDRAPLGYRAAMAKFKVGESSTVAAARQTGDTLARKVDYGFIDTLDDIIRVSEGRVMIAVEEVTKRVTDLATTQRQDAHDLYMRCEDAQYDRALLRAQVSLLTRERRYFCFVASSYEREAAYARQAWAHFESRS
ncbi:hypothetical protein Tco_0036952, partial [Tanacetum coccineum]